MQLLILGLLMVLSSAQWDVLVMWNKTFHGGYGWDGGYSIIRSDDGGYIILGDSDQGSNNQEDIWVIKIDNNGNHVWNRTFHGGYGWDGGYSIIRSDDGGYVIVGESYQGINSDDVWVIKFYEYRYDVRGNFSSNVSNNDYWINLTLDSAISWNVTLVVDGVDVNSSVGSGSSNVSLGYTHPASRNSTYQFRVNYSVGGSSVVALYGPYSVWIDLIHLL
ncbi:MAG: hypothetical protein QW044_00860 [Candidatus Anstonellales archaeon]